MTLISNTPQWATLSFLAALYCGLIFAAWRTWVLEKQVRIDKKRQLTESFAKAISLLGHESVAVKQGSIYALERFSRENRDSPSEHKQIMRSIVSFIRHERKDNLKASEDLPIDVEAAISVLANRDTSNDPKPNFEEGEFTYDLSNTNLSPYANFRGASLSGFNLSDSLFQDGIFREATFKNSNLAGCSFKGADLRKCDFENANGNNTQIHGAELHGADLSQFKNIRQEQIDAAKGDSTTKLPPHIQRPKHWPSA